MSICAQNQRAMKLLSIVVAFFFLNGFDLEEYQPNPETIEGVSWAMMQMHSLQLTRDSCADSFPARASELRAMYEASALPEFTNAFDYQRDFSGVYGTPEETRRASGMSEKEQKEYCFTMFPAMLRAFDKNYQGKSQVLLRLALEIGQKRMDQFAAQRKKTPARDPRIDSLVLTISRASQVAFQTGDWSVLANLYAPGTFDCWSGADPARSYSFIAIPSVPSNAMYELKEFGEYMTGGVVGFTNVQPTHLLEVSFTTEHNWERCGVKDKELYPRLHFFLVENDGQFSLTHACPRKEVDVTKFASAPLSAELLKASLSKLDSDEWNRIPLEVNGDRYSSRSRDRLQKDYGFSHGVAMEAVHFVCDPTNDTGRSTEQAPKKAFD